MTTGHWPVSRDFPTTLKAFPIGRLPMEYPFSLVAMIAIHSGLPKGSNNMCISKLKLTMFVMGFSAFICSNETLPWDVVDGFSKERPSLRYFRILIQTQKVFCPGQVKIVVDR